MTVPSTKENLYHEATPGQVAAARLLVKREQENKITVSLNDRIRRIAAQGQDQAPLKLDRNKRKRHR
ncbi:hypothetical protein SFC07_10540 [Corynebacterium callunae]|uniref:hypothetical protein n=1 Tax=Corynebacterium callunae TaxID=1721 RepID=UPI003982BA0A